MNKRKQSDGGARRGSGWGVKLLVATAMAAGVLVTVFTQRSISGPDNSPRAPLRLADTGLYADFATHRVRPEVLTFEPQYPLWSDGAAKKRWVHLPPGETIDASDPSHWQFPAGTKFWKEFSFGQRVETRYMERTGTGDWIYATYVWTEDGTDAVLAPESGIRGVAEIQPGVRHDIPGRYDCLACHAGQPNAVLGFGALQLSPDRDLLAPHAQVPGPDAIDLDDLLARGLLRGAPPSAYSRPPRIEAETPVERAVLGYLHANCGGCHNDHGPLSELGFSLEAPFSPDGRALSRAMDTAAGVQSSYVPSGESPGLARVAVGDPVHSMIVKRMSSRVPSLQMPPLGTHVIDEEAVALVESWIRVDLCMEVASLCHNETQTEVAK